MSDTGEPSSGGGPGPGTPGPRLRPHHPAELDEAQRRLYETVAAGPRAGGPFRLTDDEGRLLGPFDALLLAPGIGDAIQSLGAALRFSGALPDRTRELVICAVAASWRSRYEWYAHTRVGRAVGLTEDETDAVLAGEVPASATSAEGSALLLARALLGPRHVPSDLYASAVADHGTSGVFEITVLVGYYQTLAGLLEVFDVGSPEPTPFDAGARDGAAGGSAFAAAPRAD